jgi:hypothetical protein
MKATFKNTLDEFSCEPPSSSTSIDRIEVKLIFNEHFKRKENKKISRRDMKKIQQVFICFK